MHMDMGNGIVMSAWQGVLNAHGISGE
jgi:hypothetical protein